MTWIKCSDSVPPTNKQVLFVGDGKLCVGYKFSDDPDSYMWINELEQDGDGCAEDVFGVTHWMPLPELPEE